MRASRIKRTERRLWLFRLLAAMLGLSVFGLFELGLRAIGVGEPNQTDDPFVGFSDWQPLFVKTPDGERFHIPPARWKFFVEDSFPVIKTPGTFRIFVLGGSTVQGNPFSIETAFPQWLQLALREAQPNRNWEVINCGGISYASYRLVPILKECLTHDPDLMIFCGGHNEFLEDRSYAGLRDQSSVLSVPVRLAARLRSFQLLSSILAPLRSSAESRPTLRADVDAMLDYNEGTRAYHRDDAWRAGVMRHFAANLERMARMAQSPTANRPRGVPLMFVLPPSNLADLPPFKSEHRVGLSAEELHEFDRLMSAVDAVDETVTRTPAEKLSRLEQARGIDPQFAALRYRLGRFYEVQGRIAEARIEYLAAREEDICPLRILQPMEDAIRKTAQRHSLPFVDAARLLEQKTRHGIADGSMLVDHVHPSIEGHQLIAIAILEELARRGFVTTQSDWQTRATEVFQRHFDALPAVYFAKAQQTLFRHNEWARGRAAGPHISTRHPERLHENGL